MSCPSIALAPNAHHERCRRLVTEQEHSVLTQREFCDSRGIAYSTFASWRRRVLDERLAEPADDTPAFVTVELAAEAPTYCPSDTISLTLPSGVRIDGISPSTVATAAALVASL